MLLVLLALDAARPIRGERRPTGATTAAPTVPAGTSRPTNATATVAGLRPRRRPRRRNSAAARRCARHPLEHGGGPGGPECRCTPYDRDDYPYPQSIEAEIADRLGGMVSPYDGTRFESLRESDIEHILAVSEAHDSGLCAASAK